MREFVTSPSVEGKSPSPVTNAIPREWEKPLFEILNDPRQDPSARSARLIQLATVTAKDVPEVQEECLRHLAYTLSDQEPEKFLSLATNQIIPAEIRARFVEKLYEIRPEKTCEWLALRLSMASDPILSARAKEFLKNFNYPP